MADQNVAPMSRAELDQKIVALAWTDDTFREAFLADPKGEFERRLGVKLPDSLSMTAHAEDADHLCFVIPAKPKDAAELSDADLEKVAGGVDVVSTVAGTLLLATFASMGATTIATMVGAGTGKPVW